MEKKHVWWMTYIKKIWETYQYQSPPKISYALTIPLLKYNYIFLDSMIVLFCDKYTHRFKNLYHVIQFFCKNDKPKFQVNQTLSNFIRIILVAKMHFNKTY